MNDGSDGKGKVYAVLFVLFAGLMGYGTWCDYHATKENILKTTYNTDGTSTVEHERVHRDGVTELCESTFKASLTPDMYVTNTLVSETCVPSTPSVIQACPAK